MGKLIGFGSRVGRVGVVVGGGGDRGGGIVAAGAGVIGAVLRVQRLTSLVLIIYMRHAWRLYGGLGQLLTMSIPYS
jgi:hypothetical protein